VNHEPSVIEPDEPGGRTGALHEVKEPAMSVLYDEREDRLVEPCRPVVDLGDEAATQPAVSGAKAAALAAARRAGLPTLGGFVITTQGTAALDCGWCDVVAAMRAAWHDLTADGRHPLVVRSSSTVEDGAASSMAGMFTSVLDVRDWPAFREAVRTVLGSAKAVPGVAPAPMAVLVQPFIEPRFGGVLFGADPVTGRTDRRVLAAVAGGPDRLVSGEVDGARYTLGRRGKVVAADSPLPELAATSLRRLAALSADAAQVFGGPQDIEWAIGADGRPVLLQSRPITALAAVDPGRGPVFGPGPVAETFPDALSTLEDDLWVAPLRDALAEALTLTGTAGGRRLSRSPLVVSVGGRIAVDLDLLGASPRRRRWIAKLNPVPPARRLRAAWRVGRLQAALEGLVADTLADADARLLEVPALDTLTDRQLLSLVRRSQPLLRALHGHEIVAGLLAKHAGAAGPGGAGVALLALAAGRAAGLDDEALVERYPAVLALTPPRVGPAAALPLSVPTLGSLGVDAPADPVAVLREALRMRVRWTHELTARAAWELAGRLTATGVLAERESVAELTVAELADAVDRRAIPDDLALRRRSSSAPLPAAFRCTSDGRPAALAAPLSSATAGTGAGGGRGGGVVHGGDGSPAPGAVLVVRTLDPGYATVLPGLGGLVAETGSVLSHLAILAREFGVPTVVGVAGAVERFPSGSVVTVDGATGAVEIQEVAA
jgi:phosphohistidine swiveling domain-containing protein